MIDLPLCWIIPWGAGEEVPWCLREFLAPIAVRAWVPDGSLDTEDLEVLAKHLVARNKRLTGVSQRTPSHWGYPKGRTDCRLVNTHSDTGNFPNGRLIVGLSTHTQTPGIPIVQDFLWVR